MAPRCCRVVPLVLLLVLGAAAPGFAQESIYVHGRVQARNGPPLQGAQLQVLPTGPSAESDPDGSFTLGPLAAGTYRIRVRRIGFQADTITVKLPHGAGDWIVRLSQSPRVLDSVFSSALEQDLPRMMDRMRQHMGATVFGPELMKQYPGISIDDILATDSEVYPFMREASVCSCVPFVYLNGKQIPTWCHPGGRVIPDLFIRDYIRMKDIAVVEVYRFAQKSIIHEPWVLDPSAGTKCNPTILIWTKDFQQKPYKGI